MGTTIIIATHDMTLVEQTQNASHLHIEDGQIATLRKAGEGVQ